MLIAYQLMFLIYKQEILSGEIGNALTKRHSNAINSAITSDNRNKKAPRFLGGLSIEIYSYYLIINLLEVLLLPTAMFKK